MHVHASGVCLLPSPVPKEVIFSLLVFKLIQFCWTLAPTEIGREQYAIRSYLIMLPSLLFSREPSSHFPWNLELLKQSLRVHGVQQDCRLVIWFWFVTEWPFPSFSSKEKKNIRWSWAIYHWPLSPCRFSCAHVGSFLIPYLNCAKLHVLFFSFSLIFQERKDL